MAFFSKKWGFLGEILEVVKKGHFWPFLRGKMVIFEHILKKRKTINLRKKVILSYFRQNKLFLVKNRENSSF